MNTDNREMLVKAGAAGAVGFTTGGPLGAGLAVMGAVSADVLNRKLSEWEKRRVISITNLAAQEISDRVKAEESLRPGWGDGSSTYHEVVENFLLTVQRDSEEKKLPYMGHLIANMGFGITDGKGSFLEMGTDVLHRLVNEAGELSYQQLCVLRLCHVMQSDVLNLRDTDYTGQSISGTDILQRVVLLDSIRDLSSKNLIKAIEGDLWLFGVEQIVPALLRLDYRGQLFYAMMGLEEIPYSDLNSIKALLSK